MAKSSKFLKNSRILTIVGFLGTLTITGCLDDITPEREVRNYGSFGTELYNIVYDNSLHSETHSSPEFLDTFASHRETFIDAVDTSAAEEELDALNQVFIDIVPLYENMLYTGTLRKIAVVLDEFRQNPDAVAGATWLTESPKLLAEPERANPLGLLFEYEDLASITDEMLRLVLRNATGGERNATNQMLKELSIASADLTPDDDPNRFVRRAVDMLLSPSPSYAPGVAYTPQMAIKLDRRGWPKLKNAVSAPFVDADGDGLADGNDVGFFTLSNGALVAPYESFGTLPDGMSFGADGRLTYQGAPVFDTFDLQQTPIAYLLREGDALLADETLDELLRATKALLGTPQKYFDDDGVYEGFPRDSAVVQLMAAVLTTLDHDSVGPNFEAAIQVLRNDKDIVARLIHDLETLVDIVDETPSNFSIDNDLIDRLLPEVRILADKPGFLSDLLMAIDEPIVAKIAPCLAELATRKKEFIKVAQDSAYEACFQTCAATYPIGTFERMECIRACPIDDILGTDKADHSNPESLENRSLMQRVTHLMWETSETPYQVAIEQLQVGEVDLTSVAKGFGTIMSFDNLAEAYLLTFTGDLHLIDHLSDTFISLSGLIGDDGSTVAELLSHLVQNMFNLTLSVNPKTSEVTRLFNRAELITQGSNYRMELNTANCRSGYKCRQVNADTLFAIEAVGLVDALYPIVKVFNDHGMTKHLARIVSIVFEYYTTKDVTYLDISGDPLPLTPSDFRSLEPVLIRALEETNIVANVGDFGDALLNVQLADGTKLTDRFEKFVSYILTPDPKLKNIRGEASTTDRVGNVIAPLSPAYLYIDGMRELSDYLDEHPKIEDKLSNSLERVMDITIRTRVDENGSVSFEKPAGIELVASLLELLHTVYLDKTQDGTRHTWIQDDAIPELLDFVSGRILYAYFRLFDDLDANPSGLEHFRKLVLHLMESGQEVTTDLPGAAYVMMSFLLEQKNLYAILRAFSSPIDPDRVWTTEGFAELSFVVTLLTCVDAFNECDPNHAFNHVFKRMFSTRERKRMNLVRLFDIAEDLFRVNPGSPLQRTAQDQKVLLDFAHDLFTDDDRGGERIYGVIDYTIWGNDRRPADWKPEDASWQIKIDDLVKPQ